MKKAPLTQFEQTILTAVLLCRDDSYGMAVHAKTEELAERRYQLPSIYLTLDRLEEKGYVKSWMANATPQRGNRRSRYFKVLTAGEEALVEARATTQRLMDSWMTFKWLKKLKPARSRD